MTVKISATNVYNFQQTEFFLQRFNDSKFVNGLTSAELFITGEGLTCIKEYSTQKIELPEQLYIKKIELTEQKQFKQDGQQELTYTVNIQGNVVYNDSEPSKQKAFHVDLLFPGRRNATFIIDIMKKPL